MADVQYRYVEADITPAAASRSLPSVTIFLLDHGPGAAVTSSLEIVIFHARTTTEPEQRPTCQALSVHA